MNIIYFMSISSTDKGKSGESQRRKAVGLRILSMIARLPKISYAFLYLVIFYKVKI
jgi:hypothetical protein